MAVIRKIEAIRSDLRPDLKLAEIRILTGDIINARSRAIHEATADLTPFGMLARREAAIQFDELLLEALTLLPSHRPEISHSITHPLTGETLVLQSLVGEQATYVTPDKFDPDAFRMEPSDPHARMLSEITASSDVAHQITAMISMGYDPVRTPDELALELSLAHG